MKLNMQDAAHKMQHTNDNLQCGSLEAVSKLAIERAFSPYYSLQFFSWGVAPG
jgi:hypothetical protein